MKPSQFVPGPTETASPVDDYFRASLDAFETAFRRSNDSLERRYRVAGKTIRVRLATSATATLITKALEHRAASPHSVPDLTVCVWDGESTGTPAPAPFWNAGRHHAHGEVTEFGTERYYTHLDVGPNALSLVDFHENQALFWVPSPDSIPDYEISVPLRTILHVWLSRHGRHILHAGAVGLPTGGVLLVGHGGSGKSNTALACLSSPLLYLSDDHCIVSADPVPTVHGVYDTGKIFPKDIAKLPALESLGNEAAMLQTEKALFFLHEHLPHKLAESFPIKALLFPYVAGQDDSRLSPISPAAGLRAMAPGQVMQWPSAGRATFRTMAEICRRVPCFRFALGTNRPQIPEIILRLLADPRSSVDSSSMLG